jgi:hypothetical protein
MLLGPLNLYLLQEGTERSWVGPLPSPSEYDLGTAFSDGSPACSDPSFTGGQQVPCWELVSLTLDGFFLLL